MKVERWCQASPQLLSSSKPASEVQGSVIPAVLLPQYLQESLRRFVYSLAVCSTLWLGSLNPTEALEPLPYPKSYGEQLREATPISTIRGTWRIREYVKGEDLCRGRVTFKGFIDTPRKGTLEYTGCGGKVGKGNWLLKPGRVTGGQLLFSARWKVNFKGGEARLYRGDVRLDSDTMITLGGVTRPDAHIRGEVLKPLINKAGSLTEKSIGEFEADIIEVDKDEEKL